MPSTAGAWSEEEKAKVLMSIIEASTVDWNKVPIPAGRDMKSIKNMYYSERKKVGLVASAKSTPTKQREPKSVGTSTPKTPKTPKTPSKRKLSEVKTEPKDLDNEGEEMNVEVKKIKTEEYEVKAEDSDGTVEQGDDGAESILA